MAVERTDLIRQWMDILDPADGNPLRAEKVVDITSDCPRKRDRRRKALLQFTTSMHGLIVQIVDCYHQHEFGDHFHCFVNSRQLHEKGGTFEYYASNQLGITPEKLRKMIYEHAPKKVLAPS